MESKIVLRVLKEIQEVNEGDDQLKDQIYLQAIDDADIRKLEGFIRGPPDTPYENGIFHLSIRLPNEYPFKPPQVTFVTKIYHPNIRTTGGYICLDVLAQAWSPTMTLKSMLLSLQLLLQDARPDDPLEPSIARQLRTDWETFNRTAFFWTGEHALTPGERTDEWKQMNAMVSTVMKRRRMGRLRAIQTLARRKWKEVTRKRRKGDKEEEEAEGESSNAPTPVSRPRTSDQATVSTNAEEEDEEEEGGDDNDNDVPPEVLRLIGEVLVRSRTLDNVDDDDD